MILDNNAENQILDKELLEYEKVLLSIAINSSTAAYEITSKLLPEDFSTNNHQVIFSTIVQMNSDGNTLSIPLLIEKLKEKNLLNSVGGPQYITEISSYYFSDEGFEEYLEIIFKYSLSRRLGRSVRKISNLIKDSKGDSVYELVLQAQEEILNIKTDIDVDNAEKIEKIIDKVIKHTFFLGDNDVDLTGVDSGFSEVNKLTSGWQKGDFIVLAARPSMGKTAFALNLAVNAAKNKDVGVAVFSLEMPKDQLVQRVLSSTSRVDSGKIRTGKGLNDEEKTKLTTTGEIIKGYNIIIDDTPGLNVLQLQSKIRKLKRDHKIDLCIIDYLQLVSGIPNKNESRQNEVSAISRHIKKIARELKIPIICLSQLSRSVETRDKENRRPIMSDLRDSGAIEQDADIVMFLYREEYYKREETEVEGLAELIFAKHRNGAVGTIKMRFDKDYGLFIEKKE